jgi:nitrogen fixation protein NifU and related proteins
MVSSDLYKQKIIDHYKNPRNQGELSDFTYRAQVANSVCGDEVTIFLKEEDGKITEVGYKGTGCAISMAGISMLSEKLKGMTAKEIDALPNTYILTLLGMEEKSPRLKCALLSIEAARRAVRGEADDECDFC